MRTSIDKAGRVIIPAALRARAGLLPGPVDVIMDGAGIHIEAIPADDLVEKDGRLLLAPSTPALTVDEVRDLRLADQR